MSKVVSMLPRLLDKQLKEWREYVFKMAEESKDPRVKLYFTEIKTAMLFEDYLQQCGTYHPKDPANEE